MPVTSIMLQDSSRTKWPSQPQRGGFEYGPALQRLVWITYQLLKILVSACRDQLTSTRAFCRECNYIVHGSCLPFSAWRVRMSYSFLRMRMRKARTSFNTGYWDGFSARWTRKCVLYFWHILQPLRINSEGLRLPPFVPDFPRSIHIHVDLILWGCCRAMGRK
jgi:hypothetical protein